MKKALLLIAALGAVVSCNLFNGGNKKGNEGPAPADTLEITEPIVEEPAFKAVDLGLSVKWAECNLGASTPEEYGDYYAWGDVETLYVEGHGSEKNCTEWKEGKEKGHKWSTYKWSTRNGTITKYYYDGLKTLQLGENPEETLDDAARAVLGGKWRMPTEAEMNELVKKCKWIWDNTRIGYIVTADNGNCIFLPAAGYRIEKYLVDAGKVGAYWSSTVSQEESSEDAILISFRKGEYQVDNGFPRFYGIPVRPVTE